MVKLSGLSGAPVFVIIYFSNLFLTNFGLPLYFTYTLFLTYGSFYIVSRLASGHGLNSANKSVFLLHFALLTYASFIFLLFEVEIFSKESSSWWSMASFAKFLSIITASIAIIISPIDRIIKSVSIIKNFSYVIVFGSLLYFLMMPLGWSFLSSDALSGNRYNGGINSYIITGQLIIAGFVAHVLLNPKATPAKLFAAVLLFVVGIVATGDRTSIGSLLIILAILWFRTGFGASPFEFNFRKSIVLTLLLPATLFFAIAQYQNIVSGSFDSYKSTLHRITISIRSYELFQEVFPFGAGPGSQTFLMNENTIKAKFSDGDTKDGDLNSLLAKEIKSFQIKVGRGWKLSPHNTYVDFLIPFGAMGLFFVLCVFHAQFRSAKRLFFNRDSSTVVVDSYAVSALLFLMFSSIFNLWWLYLIYYRILISNKVIL